MQVIEFPMLAPEPRLALLAIARLCRETPEDGQPFRELRSRLRALKLWDKDRPLAILRFLGVGGATIKPSPFMKQVAATRSDDDALAAIADRLLELNPLLFKTIWELYEQRAHGRDEIYKIINSFAYRGRVPSRPDLEHYFNAWVAT